MLKRIKVKLLSSENEILGYGILIEKEFYKRFNNLEEYDVIEEDSENFLIKLKSEEK